jgi:hypothetical protein
MIPYLGCKQKIAKELLAAIPPAEHFYDLFGGGGSITEAACQIRENGMFGKWEKWKRVHYNEINTGVCELNREIWSGAFDFEKAAKMKITKEDFEKAKKKETAMDIFILATNSYANMGLSYFYNEYKKESYLARMEKNIKRMYKLIDRSVFITNKCYSEVKIEPNSVAYCDIPYNSIASVKRGVYYGIKFDYEKFYEWAARAKFPVYFSDYDAPKDFAAVWQKVVECKTNFRKRSTRTEKLFWNGVKI